MKTLNWKSAALVAAALLLTIPVVAQAQNAANAFPPGPNAQAYPPGPTGQAPSALPTQVLVTNTPMQPVPMVGTVVNVAQGTPVQIKLVADFGFNDFAPKATYTIPAGKRLVVGHIATRCSSNLGIGTVQTAIVHLGTGQDSSLTWLDVNIKVYQLQGTTWSIGDAASPVHANLDGGDVWVDGIRSVSLQGTLSCEVWIAGTLVNAPAQLSQ